MQATRSLVIAGMLAAFLTGCEQNANTGPASTQPIVRDVVRAEPQETVAIPLEPHAAEYLELVPPKRLPTEIDVLCVHVADPPTIDGRADDPAWHAAAEVVTLDRASQRAIQLRFVWTDTEVFALATWPDAAPSETHRSWVWDTQENVYKQGPDREDALVIKWSMSGHDAHLALHDAPQPHVADIWFWKACRTNRSGYADDKHQVLDNAADERSCDLTAADGGILHLHRHGDAGRSAYEDRFVYDYAGDACLRFLPREPEGSRADVRAKGRWEDGQWTVELRRQLDTGHADDVVLKLGQRHLFGVGCYEMTCDVVHPEWTQPLYRVGDVYDRLYLILEP
jgi:hypothetical protein